MDVFKRIQAADEDKSGSISVKELFGVIKGAAESDKQKKLFQRLLFVALFIIVLLVAAMFVVSVAAGESIKESKVSPDAAEMKAPDGSVVSTGQAEVETTIWDTALLTPYELGNLKFISFCAPGRALQKKPPPSHATSLHATSLYAIPSSHAMRAAMRAACHAHRRTGSHAYAYTRALPSSAPRTDVDLTAVATYAAWAEFTVKPTGVFKTFLNDATISTSEGHEVYIDSETSSGTIRFGSGSMAGSTYPIAEAVPDTVRRQLDEKATRNPTVTTVTTARRDELKLPREEARRRRRLGRRGGSVSGAGGFAMGGGGGRGNRCGNNRSHQRTLHPGSLLASAPITPRAHLPFAHLPLSVAARATTKRSSTLRYPPSTAMDAHEARDQGETKQGVHLRRCK